jgi:hypothetical protein
MAGHHFQRLLLPAPVLQHLTGSLDEIALDIVTRETGRIGLGTVIK